METTDADADFLLLEIAAREGSARRSVARLRPGAELERTGECRAGGDADENPFLLHELAAPFHRLAFGDGDHTRANGVTSDLRNEIGAPAPTWAAWSRISILRIAWPSS